VSDRALRSQGHLSPGVDLENLLIRNRGIRRLQRDLRALLLEPSDLQPFNTPERPVGQEGVRLQFTSNNCGQNRPVEDLNSSLLPSAKKLAFGSRSRPISIPHAQRKTELVQWPLIPATLGADLNTGLLLDTVSSPSKNTVTSESSPSGSRLLSFLSREATANRQVASEGRELAISESGGDPDNLLPPPPKRRLSLIDPQHMWSQPYSPARASSTSRRNSFSGPSARSLWSSHNPLVFGTLDLNPDTDSDNTPLDIANFPPGTAVTPAQVRRLFPGDIHKISFGPNYRNCAHLPTNHPDNWIIPYPEEKETPTSQLINPESSDIPPNQSGTSPEVVDSGIRDLVAYKPIISSSFVPTAPTASSSVSNLYISKDYSASTPFGEKRIVPGCDKAQLIVEQPETLTGLGYYSRQDHYPGPWDKFSQDENRGAYYKSFQFPERNPPRLQPQLQVAPFDPEEEEIESDTESTKSTTSLDFSAEDFHWWDTSYLNMTGDQEQTHIPTTTGGTTPPPKTTIPTTTTAGKFGSYTASSNPYPFGFGAPPHTTAPTHKKGKGGRKTSPSGMGGAGPSGNPSAGGFGTGGFSGGPSGFGNPTGFAGGFGGSGGGFGNPGGSGNPGGGFGRAPSPPQFASAGFASHSARAPAITLYQPPGLDNFIYDGKTSVKPFLRKFKDLCNRHGWTEESAMSNVQFHLKKAALHMYKDSVPSNSAKNFH
jgi:hypothetical protein